MNSYIPGLSTRPGSDTDDTSRPAEPDRRRVHVGAAHFIQEDKPAEFAVTYPLSSP